ncbi:MAG: hypothetical protein ACXV9P_13085 [Acidimicrobiia bacterium]
MPRHRWGVEANEPFNAGLGGISPEIVRYKGPANDRTAIALLWLTAIALIGLGVAGPSIILGGLGGLLFLALVVRLVGRSGRRRRSSKRRVA